MLLSNIDLGYQKFDIPGYNARVSLNLNCSTSGIAGSRKKIAYFDCEFIRHDRSIRKTRYKNHFRIYVHSFRNRIDYLSNKLYIIFKILSAVSTFIGLQITIIPFGIGHIKPHISDITICQRAGKNRYKLFLLTEFFKSG